MLCYTLADETLIPGIVPVEIDGVLYVAAGDDSKDEWQTMPLGKTLAEKYKEVVKKEGDGIAMLEVSFSNDGCRIVEELRYCPRCWGVLNTICANGREIFVCTVCKQQATTTKEDKLALILTKPEAKRGSVRYESGIYQPRYHRGRLLQEFCAFPPPGISAELFNIGPCNEPWGLFVMSPKTSFRVVRNGPNAAVVEVSWTGKPREYFNKKENQWVRRDPMELMYFRVLQKNGRKAVEQVEMN